MPTSALLDEQRLDAAVREWTRSCGRELQRRRKVNDWTQIQLAELCGVQHTAVSKAELGLILPKVTVQLAIVSALSCEIVDIWPPLGRHFIMNVARAVVAA